MPSSSTLVGLAEKACPKMRVGNDVQSQTCIKQADAAAVGTIQTPNDGVFTGHRSKAIVELADFEASKYTNDRRGNLQNLAA